MFGKLYWYDTDKNIVDCIIDAVEKFIEKRGYAPSIAVVREDVYTSSLRRSIIRTLKKRGLKAIEVGHNPTITPSHFHLYPFVNRRIPKTQIERRPLL